MDLDDTEGTSGSGSGRGSGVAMEYDENTTSYVSKRTSGAYSPMAKFDAGMMNEGVSTPFGSTGVGGGGVGSGVGGSSYNRRSSPMATPMGMGMAMAMDVNTPTTTTGGSGRVNIQPSPQAQNQSQSNAGPSFAARASLDGDYRPYYDATLSLLQSQTVSSTSRRQDANAVFVKRIMASNYSRSSSLQHKNNNNDSAGSSKEKAIRGTVQQLEMEGHIWSLLTRLMASEEAQTQSHNNNDNNGSMLLWDPSFSAAHSVQEEIRTFINTIVPPNAPLDPASMFQMVSECFDDDDDDAPGAAANINVNVPSLPTVVKRRQIILDWVEDCHNRAVASVDVTLEKEQVMWKDSLAALKNSNNSHSSGGGGGGGFFPPSALTTSANEEKIDACHPDAHLLKIKNSSKSSSAISNPFYGKDEANEIALLKTCLNLIKAGRMEDVWELCTCAGQPWRAAAWDGNTAHGYIQEDINGNGNSNGVEGDDGATMMMTDGNDESKMQEFQTRVGNPQRALWKRNMWQASEALHALVQENSTSTSTSTNNKTSRGGSSSSTSGSSIVYEAAITAILADDTRTASKNPLLQNWMDALWIYYRGLQARFMEMVYHSHNNARRSLDVRQHYYQSKYALEGAEYNAEEEEQLRSTEEMSRLEEGTFIHRFREQSNSNARMVSGSTQSAGDSTEWYSCMNAFLTGTSDVHGYLKSTIESLLRDANGDALSSSTVVRDRDEYEPLLRFVLHMTIFLESFSQGHEQERQRFDSIIGPRRNDLLLTYVHQLMEQKPLWEFVCLYASLLPEESIVEAISNFWAVAVVDEKDRRMALKLAHDYFGDGLDLVILRNVVRSSIGMSTEDADAMGIASLLSLPEGDGQINAALENSISHDDVRKMHSVRWMCLVEKHYSDALVCANMLLRKFLLAMAPSDDNSTFSYNNLNDWTGDSRLHTAKVFLKRFLPADLTSVAMSSKCLNDYSLSDDDSEQYLEEHEGLIQILEAHSSYESWKSVIVKASPASSFTVDVRFQEGSTEREVAMNMETMRYIKQKKESARLLLHAANLARDSLVNMLKDGWLLDVDIIGEGMGNDSAAVRKKEITSLQSKCLPTIVFLAFRVLYDTAQWMNEFGQDVKNIFAENAGEVLSRICRGGSEWDEDEEVTNRLYLSSTWYREALLLANIVASESNGVTASMTKKELGEFMAKLTDTNIRLLKEEQDNLRMN